MLRYIAGFIFLSFWAAIWTGEAVGQIAAVPISVAKPGARDMCPVCGMLVSKYPNWVATITSKDGHVYYFDGAKDMFKFLQSIPKYAPGFKVSDISSIAVTEFYNLERVEAAKALYVFGSDVMGPMGHELVPFATREDAEDFLADHKGRRILRYDEVTPDIISRIDTGKF
jgi:nitrous oxide reductase accessory protein NosL